MTFPDWSKLPPASILIAEPVFPENSDPITAFPLDRFAGEASQMPFRLLSRNEQPEKNKRVTPVTARVNQNFILPINPIFMLESETGLILNFESSSFSSGEYLYQMTAATAPPAIRDLSINW